MCAYDLRFEVSFEMVDEGEVVFGRFILRKINYESIDVGFVGPWKETRRVGLTP